MALRYTGGANDGFIQDCLNFGLVNLAAYRVTDQQFIKANSSLTKAIAYADPTVATSGGTNPTASTWNSVVSKEEAAAHDLAFPADQWLVRNSGGTPLVDKAHSADYLLYTGAASYQGTAITRVAARLALGSSYDGIFWDNTSPTYLFRASDTAHPSGNAPGFVNGVSLTDAGWRSGQLSFIATVSKHFKDLGYLMVGNAAYPADNDGTQTETWWNDIATTGQSGLTDLHVEFYEFGPEVPSIPYYNPPGDWHSHYNDWLSVPTTAYSLGMTFSGGGYVSTTNTANGIYGKATFLLTWNGINGYWNPRASDSGGPWQAAWSQDIGVPDVTINSGNMVSVGAGWQRTYTSGIVCVNPNPAGGASITFNFPKSYKNLAGTFVTGVTLAPTTAAILTET
jgi:hypothetical protein